MTRMFPGGIRSGVTAAAAVAALAVVAVPPMAAPAAGAVGSLPAAPATVAVHAPLIATTPGSKTTSSNWSGYALSAGHPFTSVSSSWVEPTAACTSATSYSAFWVGLDGYTDTTVEQDGTAVDCSSGTPSYYAWYEMYPAAPVTVRDVEPGDVIDARVASTGGGRFTLTIADTTSGWSTSVTKSLKSAKLGSAEVIAEAPCCTGVGGPLPLTDFGTVSFTDSLANGQSFGSLSPTKITMKSGKVVKALPGALTGGEAFTVTWKHK